jgi:Tol biopolymer transport system component
LTGCGGSSSHGRYFAYIQYTGEGDTAAAAHHQAHTGAKRPAAAAAHKATVRAAAQPATTSIGTGSEDIYVYDTHTNTSTDVLSGLDVESVQISYDGKKGVVVGYDTVTGYDQVYLFDRQFITGIQLTSDLTWHYDATFSADGSTITYDAYDSTLDTPLEQLYTIPTTAPYTVTEIKTPALYAYGPAFTPDGLSLVFDGEPGGESETEAIYIVKIATGAVTQLSLPAYNATIEQFDYVPPSVSPDGTQVSFSRDTYTIATDLDTYDVYVMPITGETLASPATGLTTGNPVTAGTSEEPLYLDNSKKDIVYLSWEANVPTVANPTGDYASNIFEMNRDGTTGGLAKTQLTSGTLDQYFNDDF